MKKLDRYILGEFFAPLGLVVLGMAMLVALVQVVDTLPRLRENNTSGTLIALYHLLQFPYLVTQAVPVGVMLATLVALGNLARGSELAAMGAGGVSRARIALPILMAALGVSLSLWAVSELVVPRATTASRYVLKALIEKRDVNFDTPWRNHMTKRLSGDRALYARDFDAHLGRMAEVTVVRTVNGRVAQRLDAERLNFIKGKQWQAEKGIERTFDSTGQLSAARSFREWPLDLGVIPTDLMVDSDKRDEDLLQLSMAQLSNIVDLLRATGSDFRRELICLHVRISYPFSCLVLALLGVSLPYLFPSGRRATTGAALGVLVSLACGILFLVFIKIGISLGTSGKLPVILSAWIGNIVFAIAGGWTLWKVNR